MNYYIDLIHVFYYTVDLLFCSQNIFVYKTGYENYFTETLLDANNSCMSLILKYLHFITRKLLI